MKLATCALALAFGGLAIHLVSKYGDVSADSEGLGSFGPDPLKEDTPADAEAASLEWPPAA